MSKFTEGRLKGRFLDRYSLPLASLDKSTEILARFYAIT
jgi:hypothetical protein